MFIIFGGYDEAEAFQSESHVGVPHMLETTNAVHLPDM